MFVNIDLKIGGSAVQAQTPYLNSTLDIWEIEFESLSIIPQSLPFVILILLVFVF